MLHSEVEFASLLAYAPRGQSAEAVRARDLTYALKADKLNPRRGHPATHVIVEHLLGVLRTLPFAAWFGPHVTLVPMPKSALMKPGTLWVPQRLVRSLAAAELGYGSELLRRTEAVAKAGYSTSGAGRPTADAHYRTLAVDRSLRVPEEILVVDDVITTGASVLAAASLLSDAYPEARVRAFSVIRTISNADEFEALVAPCVGVVSMNNTGRTHREP